MTHKIYSSENLDTRVLKLINKVGYKIGNTDEEDHVELSRLRKNMISGEIDLFKVRGLGHISIFKVMESVDIVFAPRYTGLK